MPTEEFHPVRLQKSKEKDRSFEHGLGHLLPPYENKSSRTIPRPSAPLAELGVSRWQYDFWYLILEAALNGRGARTEFDKLPNFNKPAVSRYSASTPKLLNWFERFNLDKSYRNRVKPFNFLLASQARFDLRRSSGRSGKGSLDQLSPISAYDRNYEKALRHCFDRNTGKRILRRSLETYHELLNQYHLHPEAKFQNGDYSDCGFTERRQVVAVGIEHIGKEANRLEEQWFLGSDDDAHISYGFTDDYFTAFREDLVRGCEQYGLNQLARVSNASARHISRILRGQVVTSLEVMVRLHDGVRSLEQEANEQAAFIAKLRKKCAAYGLRKLAKKATVDPANLSHILNATRPLGVEMQIKLRDILSE